MSRRERRWRNPAPHPRRQPGADEAVGSGEQCGAGGDGPFRERRDRRQSGRGEVRCDGGGRAGEPASPGRVPAVLAERSRQLAGAGHLSEPACLICRPYAFGRDSARRDRQSGLNSLLVPTAIGSCRCGAGARRPTGRTVRICQAGMQHQPFGGRPSGLPWGDASGAVHLSHHTSPVLTDLALEIVGIPTFS